MSLNYVASQGQYLFSSLLSVFASPRGSSLETKFVMLALYTLTGSALNDVLSSLQVPYAANRFTVRVQTREQKEHIHSNIK